MRIRADLFVRFLREGCELGLGKALVLDVQLHGKSEAAALAWPDRDGARDRRTVRILLVLLGDEVERAAEAGGVTGRKKIFRSGRVGLARSAHRLRNGEVGAHEPVA